MTAKIQNSNSKSKSMTKAAQRRAAQMDRALERVSRAWDALHAAKARACEIQEKMGGAPSYDDPDQGREWVEYARERDYDRDIHSLFGDLGA